VYSAECIVAAADVASVGTKTCMQTRPSISRDLEAAGMRSVRSRSGRTDGRSGSRGAKKTICQRFLSARRGAASDIRSREKEERPYVSRVRRDESPAAGLARRRLPRTDVIVIAEGSDRRRRRRGTRPFSLFAAVNSGAFRATRALGPPWGSSADGVTRARFLTSPRTLRAGIPFARTRRAIWNLIERVNLIIYVHSRGSLVLLVNRRSQIRTQPSTSPILSRPESHSRSATPNPRALNTSRGREITAVNARR